MESKHYKTIKYASQLFSNLYCICIGCQGEWSEYKGLKVAGGIGHVGATVNSSWKEKQHKDYLVISFVISFTMLLYV